MVQKIIDPNLHIKTFNVSVIKNYHHLPKQFFKVLNVNFIIM